MMEENYRHGFLYETFYRKATGSMDQIGSEMSTLLQADAGKYSVPGYSRAKQMEKAKKNMLKAFDIFLKKKLSDDERYQIEHLRQTASMALRGSDLCRLLPDALRLTERFK